MELSLVHISLNAFVLVPNMLPKIIGIMVPNMIQKWYQMTAQNEKRSRQHARQAGGVVIELFVLGGLFGTIFSIMLVPCLVQFLI